MWKPDAKAIGDLSVGEARAGRKPLALHRTLELNGASRP
jgi:hypothetical protein